MRTSESSNAKPLHSAPHDQGQISLLTHLGPIEVLASLGSNMEGLSEPEAARRLKEYGHNAVEERRKTHFLLRFIHECTHLFAWILWIAAGLAVTGEILRPHQGMAQLAVAIVIVVLVNAIFLFSKSTGLNGLSRRFG